MRGWIHVASIAGVSLVAMGVYKARQAGEFNDVVPVPLACRAVSGLVGPEDITVSVRRQVAYISATDWRSMVKKEPAAGGLYLYRPGDGKPRRLSDGLGPSFHPHGISLWSDGSIELLYVISHRAEDSHVIEVFEVRDDTLHHLETVQDERLISPNDLVAVARGELYVTNDHGVARGAGQLVDDLLGRSRAQIVHIKYGRSRILVDDLAYANGINVSADGKQLVVAETIGRRIRTYTRALESGDLTLETTRELGTGVDNIERAADGSWFIGAHPKLVTFLRHAGDENIAAPSEVLRIRGSETMTVYRDLGTELSASSVAAPLGNHLLIGAVFANHFLDCTLP